jgi:ribosomal protein L37AE/L43A
MRDRNKGMYAKYRVKRLDGKEMDSCIVLELTDPNSWPALRTWADTVEADGYVPLAAEMRAKVDQYEQDHAECPDCGEKGSYDGRILVGGRGVYRCSACGAKWQNADEKPSNKGTPIT